MAGKFTENRKDNRHGRKEERRTSVVVKKQQKALKKTAKPTSMKIADVVPH